MIDQPKLTIDKISKAFPGVIALDQVSFSVTRGTVHVIVGENGAGKSTLMNIINGSYEPTEGKLLIDGEEISFRSLADAEVNGIRMIHQELAYIPNFTIEKFLMVGREPLIGNFIIDWKELSKRALKILEAEGIIGDPKQLIGNLSVGQQQLLEIVKATSTPGLEILIMDEPTSALTQEETRTLFKKIEQLKEKGTTILYISHKLDEIFAIADQITVLRDGRHIITENISHFNYENLIQYMVGRKISDYYPPKHITNSSNKILSLNNVTTTNRVKNINFYLYEGEVLGVAGLMGAGRSELLRGIFGLDPVIEGEIIIDGSGKKFSNNRDAAQNGIAFVPEDRRREGIIANRSVRENISLSSLDKISRFKILNKPKENKLVQKFCRLLNVKTPNLDNKVGFLSGGNQQKVVLGRWLMKNPNILLLDDPTRGIDVGAKNEIYLLINQLAKEGKSIILVSSELGELIGLCNRIYVMHEGSIAGVVEGDEITQEKIMTLATGRV